MAKQTSPYSMCMLERRGEWNFKEDKTEQEKGHKINKEDNQGYCTFLFFSHFFFYYWQSEGWREVKVLNGMFGVLLKETHISSKSPSSLSLMHLLTLNITCGASENASWLVSLITGSPLTRAGPRPRQNTDSTWAPHRPAPHTNEY